MVSVNDNVKFISTKDADYLVVHFLPGSKHPAYQAHDKWWDENELSGCTDKLQKFIGEGPVLAKMNVDVRVITSMTHDQEMNVRQAKEREYETPNNNSSFMIVSDAQGRYSSYCAATCPIVPLPSSSAFVYQPHSLIIVRKDYDSKHFEWSGTCVGIVRGQDQLSSDLVSFIRSHKAQCQHQPDVLHLRQIISHLHTAQIASKL